MAPVESKHVFEADIQMQAPDGHSIDVHLAEARAISHDGRIMEAVIAFTIPADQYTNLVNPNELFNSKAERRQGNPSLTAGTPVEITARASTVQALQISRQGDRAEDVANALRTAGPGSDLLQTESWYALEIKQEVPVPPEVGSGTLKEGYKLTW